MRSPLETTARLPAPAETLLRRGLAAVGGRPFADRAEEPVLSGLVRALDGDDVFYDVGAYAGFYGRWVGALAGAEVVAFEPSPAYYPRARRACAKAPTPTTVLPFALGATGGTAALSAPAPAAEGCPALSNSRSEGTKVGVFAGDSLVDEYNFPAPTAMKVDVEGAELEVLRGFADRLASGSVDPLFVEVHPPGTDLASTMADFDATPGRLRAFLADLGYAVERVTDFGDHYHLAATR